MAYLALGLGIVSAAFIGGVAIYKWRAEDLFRGGKTGICAGGFVPTQWTPTDAFSAGQAGGSYKIEVE